MPIEDAVRLLDEAGWEHRREGTSHHVFTKPGKRTLVVVERHGKINAAAVADVAEAVAEAGTLGRGERPGSPPPRPDREHRPDDDP